MDAHAAVLDGGVAKLEEELQSIKAEVGATLQVHEVYAMQRSCCPACRGACSHFRRSTAKGN